MKIQSLFSKLGRLTVFLSLIITAPQPWAVTGHDGGYTVITSIPVSADGLLYSGAPAPESLVWGPSTLTLDEEQQFWIGNAAGREVVRIETDGRIGERYRLGDAIVGLDDVAVTSDGLWVLDTAAATAHVAVFDRDGSPKGNVDLANGWGRAEGYTGLDADPDTGQVFLIGPGSAEVYNRSTGLRAAPLASVSRVYGSDPVRIVRSADTWASSATLAFRDLKIAISVESALVGVEVLHASKAMGIYLLISQLDPSLQTIQVDEVVRHYDAKTGEPLEEARVPLAERFTFIEHGTVVSRSGAAYSLVTRADRMDVVQLIFVKPGSLGTLQSAPRPMAKPMAQPNQRPLAACISRNSVMASAAAFTNNVTMLLSVNINGACSGRIKPRYLGGPGTYTSVPYDWGGFDSVAGYNWYMSAGAQAGDIDIAASEPCSHGVDCSGYVSRAWGLSDRYGTGLLPTISQQIAIANLQRGDILNLSGTHVVLFSSNGGSNVSVYESTSYNNYDRVVYGTYPWSRFNGYTPYKYNNICQ